MDTGIAQGVVDPRLSYYREIVEARDVAKITFVGFHTGFVGPSYLEQGHPFRYALLKYRADNLLNYILKECSSSAVHLASSVQVAFNSMDEELKRMVEKEGDEEMPFCEKALWATGYNSLVVAIDHEKNEILVAGGNTGWSANVLLARKGREYSLSHMGDSLIHHHKFKSTDDYLIVASLHLWWYVDREIACFVRVLESRVPELGLEEACRSMVGLYPDHTKSIVAVPLNRKRPHEHESKRQQLLDDEEDECESEVDEATCMESANDAQRGDCFDKADKEPWVPEEDDDGELSWEESYLSPWDKGERRPHDPKTSVWYARLPTTDPYPGISCDASHWGKKTTTKTTSTCAETTRKEALPRWAVGSIWEKIARDRVQEVK